MPKVYPSSSFHATKLGPDDEPASAVRPLYTDTAARLILVEALDTCEPAKVARKLAVSEDLVRGWRRGKSYPNLDQLCRAPESFSRRIALLLTGHLDTRQIVHRDPRQALHLATLSLGMLLVQIDRKPLDRMTPEERREVREEAGRLEEQARQIRQAASEPVTTDAK